MSAMVGGMTHFLRPTNSMMQRMNATVGPTRHVLGRMTATAARMSAFLHWMTATAGRMDATARRMTAIDKARNAFDSVSTATLAPSMAGHWQWSALVCFTIVGVGICSAEVGLSIEVVVR
jgi:hypothetical protein